MVTPRLFAFAALLSLARGQGKPAIRWYEDPRPNEQYLPLYASCADAQDNDRVPVIPNGSIQGRQPRQPVHFVSRGRAEFWAVGLMNSEAISGLVQGDVLISNDGGQSWFCRGVHPAVSVRAGSTAMAVRRQVLSSLDNSPLAESRAVCVFGGRRLDEDGKAYGAAQEGGFCSGDGKNWIPAAPLPVAVTGATHVSIPRSSKADVPTRSASHDGSTDAYHVIVGGSRADGSEDVWLAEFPPSSYEGIYEHSDLSGDALVRHAMPQGWRRIPVAGNLLSRLVPLATWLPNVGQLLFGSGEIPLGRFSDSVPVGDVDITTGGLQSPYPLADLIMLDILPALTAADAVGSRRLEGGNTSISSPLIPPPMVVEGAVRIARLPLRLPEAKSPSVARAFSLSVIGSPSRSNGGVVPVGKRRLPSEKEVATIVEGLLFVSGGHAFGTFLTREEGVTNASGVTVSGDYSFVTTPFVRLDHVGRDDTPRTVPGLNVSGSFDLSTSTQRPLWSSLFVSYSLVGLPQPAEEEEQEENADSGSDIARSSSRAFPHILAADATSGRLYRGSMEQCVLNASCIEGETFSSSCQASPYDAVCLPCSSCIPGKSYLTAKCLPRRDTMCASCDNTCPPGEVLLLMCGLPGNPYIDRPLCVPEGEVGLGPRGGRRSAPLLAGQQLVIIGAVIAAQALIALGVVAFYHLTSEWTSAADVTNLAGKSVDEWSGAGADRDAIGNSSSVSQDRPALRLMGELAWTCFSTAASITCFTAFAAATFLSGWKEAAGSAYAIALFLLHCPTVIISSVLLVDRLSPGLRLRRTLTVFFCSIRWGACGLLALWRPQLLTVALNQQLSSSNFADEKHAARDRPRLRLLAHRQARAVRFVTLCALLVSDLPLLLVAGGLAILSRDTMSPSPAGNSNSGSSGSVASAEATASMVVVIAAFLLQLWHVCSSLLSSNINSSAGASNAAGQSLFGRNSDFRGANEAQVESDGVSSDGKVVPPAVTASRSQPPAVATDGSAAVPANAVISPLGVLVEPSRPQLMDPAQQALARSSGISTAGAPRMMTEDRQMPTAPVYSPLAVASAAGGLASVVMPSPFAQLQPASSGNSDSRPRHISSDTQSGGSSGGGGISDASLRELQGLPLFTLLTRLRLAAATPEGHRLAAMRTYFTTNQGLLPHAILAVAQIPLPRQWVQLLMQLERQIDGPSPSASVASGDDGGTSRSDGASEDAGDGSVLSGSQRSSGSSVLMEG